MDGLPEHIIKFMLHAWRSGTKKQYAVFLQRWDVYCAQENIQVFAPILGNILQFLWELFQSGLSYSALNMARSALSSIITLDGVPAGQHMLVVKFMKSAFQQRPALPRNTVIWDVDIVLRYLRSLSLVKQLPLKLLTQKLTMLLLLLSGQRQQTIYLLDVRNMSLSFSRASFRVGDLVKQSRPGHHVEELRFTGYAPDRRLCIITVLKAYLTRTLSIRGTTTKLLLTYGRPIHAATCATIRRWATAVLLEAGVDLSIFTPHSTRAASTSVAGARVPLSTIMGAAGWSRESTFREYYDKPIDKSGQFEQAVLAKCK